MTNFINMNIILSLMIIFIMVVRSCGEKSISPKIIRIIWQISLIIFFMPYIPKIFFFELGLNVENNVLNYAKSVNEYVESTGGKDLFVSVSGNNMLFYIWIGGIVINGILFIIEMIKLRFMKIEKCSSYIFEKYCSRLSVNADLYMSDKIYSPFSFGLFIHRVVIPDIKTDENHLKNIFIHELIHYKHNDNILNFVLCVIRIIYWYNPFVYLYYNTARLDMEIYCDYDALKYIDNNLLYGETLINCADRKRIFSVNFISSSGRSLKKRLIRIKENKRNYSRFFNFVILVIIALFLGIGGIYANANSFCYNLFSENISSETINLSNYFTDGKGTFVLYDMNNMQYYVYNKAMALKRFSPCSVYKIAIALNGIESGVISNEENFRFWNGESYPFEEWNGNQDLNSAMKYSVNWYFQDIDGELGKEQIKNFLNKVDYGNKNCNGNAKNYWLDGTLKISAAEQVIFLRKLINNELSFDYNNIEVVFDTIKIKEGYYGKTGTENINGKITGGRYAGFIRSSNNTYIFCTVAENHTGSEVRKITEDILKSMGIM